MSARRGGRVPGGKEDGANRAPVHTGKGKGLTASGSEDAPIAYRIRGESATRKLAGRLAELLCPGDVVLLVGELGTGKTCFVQGIAEGLGVRERVLSPTFTLLREYTGRLPLYHLDAYRLEGPGDLSDLGLEEYLEGQGVVVVEWADRVRDFFAGDCLEVSLCFDEGGEARRVSLRFRGDSWRVRLPRLRGEKG